jgi:alkanesulfonate monooxygenase SsuD/methylene tetrahydromethanopterin reductase-like flavin-dependent oxidoreductase (luciferase family)
MRFGLFGSAQAARGGDPAFDRAQGFKDFVAYNVAAEELGFHSSFLVEHHFTGIGQVSATLGLLSWVAAHTKTLRLGTAVIVLPWHNPVLLAEEAATLDLMSGGRLDFGVGKGYRHSEFEGFCLPIAEAEARFLEAVELITKAWISDRRFSHEGKYWRFKDIIVEPPPAQTPHPPFWMAAGSAASIRQVAALGFNLLLDQFAPVDVIGERIKLFRSEIEARGRRFDPLRVAVARNFHVARDAAEKEAALRRAALQHERMIALSQDPAHRIKSHILSYADQPGSSEASALYGTPDEISHQITALAAQGVHYLLLNGGGPDLGNLRRFASEIMPKFPQ